MARAVGRHADDFRFRPGAGHFRLERAPDAAVRASGAHGALGLSQSDDGLFDERARRAGLDTGPAGYALGLHERLVLARRDLRVEAATLDGQGKRALHFIAGAHAT